MHNIDIDHKSMIQMLKYIFETLIKILCILSITLEFLEKVIFPNKRMTALDRVSFVLITIDVACGERASFLDG